MPCSAYQVFISAEDGVTDREGARYPHYQHNTACPTRPKLPQCLDVCFLVIIARLCLAHVPLSLTSFGIGRHSDRFYNRRSAVFFIALLAPISLTSSSFSYIILSCIPSLPVLSYSRVFQAYQSERLLSAWHTNIFLMYCSMRCIPLISP